MLLFATDTAAGSLGRQNIVHKSTVLWWFAKYIAGVPFFGKFSTP